MFVLVMLLGAACEGAPRPSASTPTPASLSSATADPLGAGRYVTDGSFEPSLVLTIPDGWSVSDYGPGRASLLKRDGDVNAVFATVYRVSAVYEDPCEGGVTDANAAANAQALVESLRAQQGFDMSELSEGTLDGRSTWTWEVAPTVDVSTCANDPWLYQWQSPGPSGESAADFGTLAGAVQRLTVVDLDGAPLLLEVGWFEWTTEGDIAEAAVILDSLTFD